MEEINLAPTEQKKNIKKSIFSADDEQDDDEQQKPQQVSAFKRGEGAVLVRPKQVATDKPVEIALKPNGNWFERLHNNIYATTKQELPKDSNNVYDADEGEELPLEEGLIYARDVEARPDEPELDTYQKVSMNDFQSAMLRTMGITEEATEAKESAEIRPSFLGFGAKVTEDATELGAWGKGARGRADTEYVPVQRINRRTGEVEMEDVKRERSRERRRSSHKLHSEARSRRNDYRDRSPKRGSDREYRRHYESSGSRNHSGESRHRRKYGGDGRRK